MEKTITLREFMKLPYIVNFYVNDYLANCILYLSKYDMLNEIHYYADKKFVREDDTLKAAMPINGTVYSYDDIVTARMNYGANDYTDIDLAIIKDCIIDLMAIAEEDFMFDDNDNTIYINNSNMYFNKIEDYYIYRIDLKNKTLLLISENAMDYKK